MIKSIKSKIKTAARKEMKGLIADWDAIRIDIAVPPRPALLNHKCWLNAMDSFKRGDCVAILEVINDDWGIAHYLCVNEKGKVFDPTLGEEWSGAEYKLHKYIRTDQPIYDRIDEFKQEMFDMLSKSTKRKCKLVGLKPSELF